MKSFVPEILLGLILAACTFLWLSLEYAIGLHTTLIEYHPIVTNVFALIPIYILARGIRGRRNRLGGQISWGQGILSGMVISVVMGILACPVQILFFKFVNPTFFSTFIAYAVSHGKATQEEAEAFFSMKNYAIQGSIFPLVAGLITAVIVTAIVRRTGNKSKPQPQSAAA